MKLEAEITRAGYDEKTILLSNINVKADEGRVILIAGSSGSGKTTLLLSLTGVLKHLLNGIVDGSISINGLNPLILEDFEKLPGNISVLMQDPERQLIFPTPLDELSTSLEAIGYPHVEALKQASIILSEIGLSNKVNIHVEDLSSGERRKLTLALIQVGDPPIYMLDEPSANLDPQTVALLRDNVKNWKKNGKTVLIVEHKIHYFRDLADEIYVLRGGKLGEFFVINDMLVNLPECKSTSSSERKVVLEFEGYIGYNDTPIVRNAEFKARRGELISIVGPNGSGKTTLLKTLAGFLKPVDGEVKIFTKKYFYAPQNPDLVFVHRTVRKELESIARKTGIPLHELTFMYPWFTKMLDKSPYQLSHGQRRLLELLIAFAHGEELILLDEPTTGLDAQLYEYVIKELRTRVSKGSTVIVATHDPRLVLESSRVYIIESGKIKEDDKCRVAESMFKSMGVIYE